MRSTSTVNRASLVATLVLFAACAPKNVDNQPTEATQMSPREGSTTATSGSTSATTSSTTATQTPPSVDERVPASKPGGTQPVSTQVTPSAQTSTPSMSTASTAMVSGSSAPISQDPALAKKGEKLFNTKACGTCHTVGKGRLAGPDLAGVHTRREAAWLRTWLHDPPAMIASGDAAAVALVAEYKGVKMPNMKLTDADIDALLAYIASKTK